jgi:hypothetical protein
MSRVEIGVEEARKVLGSLITAAARDGQVTVISKGGIPAAALVSLGLLRQITPMTCMSCGEAILAGVASEPCHNCGSVDRLVSVSDHAAATDAIVGVDASLPRSPRPWQAMWAEVESRLDRLRSWYAGNGPVNVSELYNEVTAYFVACYQLKDQIKRDPGVPRDLRDGVEDFVHQQDILNLVGDIANTYKHGQLSRTCDITQVVVRQTGAFATITCWTRDGGEDSKDSLDLAEEAVQAWRTYLREHGLLEA